MGDEEKRCSPATSEEREAYNAEGGPRRLVVENGVILAVAPGLRLVPATDEEKARFLAEHPNFQKEEKEEYGLPV